MRVLHIVPGMFGPSGLYGGAERYALELARATARQVPTRLVGFGPQPAWETVGTLETFTLRNQLPHTKFATSPASLALLPHLRWAEVIHCHQIYTMSTSAALLYGRCCRKPVFVTDHAGGGLSLQSWFDLQSWFAGRLWVSAFSRGAHPPLPGDRIVLAGVNAQRFCPPAAGERGGEVLYVGRLLEVKAVHELIAAVDDETPVAILGPAYDADYKERLEHLARGKQVRFLPASDGADLVAAYQRALCVVLPGIEAFGLTALEAMACGTPVIGCIESGLPEAIHDGVEGWLVRHGDRAGLAEKLRWMREHTPEAAAMGAAARRRIEAGLTWDALAERCLEAYGG
ncbi:MAG TPA: glycosyltransferase family 4 protein [Terriglobales bacterium]|nr:glycosyltransferase family 4 protein [Terriglobales bacterium]